MAAQVEQEALKEINAARTDPAAYAAHVKPMLALFEGNVLKIPGQTPLITNEGPDAVNELLTFLQGAKAVPALDRVSPGMCAAARDHAVDLGKSGGTGHDGSDGSSPFDRLNRHGEWLSAAAENIALGDGTARDRVVQLLIDDGVASRGHRLNIFNPAFRVLGVADGPHPEYGSLQVQTFAQDYTEGKSAAAATTSPAKPAAAKPVAVKPATSPAGKPTPPPGGRVDVKTSVVKSGNKKTTTVTTVTTQADGSSSTTVETREEIIG